MAAPGSIRPDAKGPASAGPAAGRAEARLAELHDRRQGLVERGRQSQLPPEHRHHAVDGVDFDVYPGQVVGIVGEAGVGKSRLLLEMRNLLPQGKYSYLEGQCLHYGGSMIYLPILDILRSYFDIKEGDREFLIKKQIEEKVVVLDKELKRSIPPFQTLLSLKVDEKEFVTIIFNEIPAWPFQTIIPFGFALMSIRFIISGINTLTEREEN